MERPATQTAWPSRLWARIVAVTGVFGAAMIFLDRSATCAPALAPACVLTARSVAQVLSWTGMECQRDSATLIQPGGFGYEISFGCTGIIPAALLAAAILVASGRLRARLWGAAIGAVGMLLVNLVRLISLFYVGVVAPQYFSASHSIVWQALTVFFVVGFFYAWKRRSALRLTARLDSASH